MSSNKSTPGASRRDFLKTSADFVGFRLVRPVEEQDNLKGLRSKVTRQSR